MPATRSNDDGAPIARQGRRGVKAALLPLALLAVVACSSTRRMAGAIGADDQHQLNAAAAMLDSNSVDANALGDHESSPHD